MFDWEALKQASQLWHKFLLPRWLTEGKAWNTQRHFKSRHVDRFMTEWGAQETVWGCAENNFIAIFENGTFRSPDSSMCCQAALSESCRQ